MWPSVMAIFSLGDYGANGVFDLLDPRLDAGGGSRSVLPRPSRGTSGTGSPLSTESLRVGPWPIMWKAM